MKKEKNLKHSEFPVAVSPTAQWLENHKNEVLHFTGKDIAIHPTLGIICSGDFETVYEEIKQKGLLDQVTFAFISFNK